MSNSAQSGMTASEKRAGPEGVARESADVLTDRMKDLAQFFPEALTEGKVDFEKLRESLGEFVDDRPERYSFTWAGKRDCIRLLQTPSRATLVPSPEESIDWDTTSNVFIEGDNSTTDKWAERPGRSTLGR